jgi:hypothetical protein
MMKKSGHPPRCLCRVDAGSNQPHSVWEYKRGLDNNVFDKYIASKTFTPSRIEVARHFYDLGRQTCIDEISRIKQINKKCSCVDGYECEGCAAQVNAVDLIIESLKENA